MWAIWDKEHLRFIDMPISPTSIIYQMCIFKKKSMAKLYRDITFPAMKDWYEIRKVRLESDNE